MTCLLSEPSYAYGGKYRFTLTSDLVVDLSRGFRGHHELCDGGKTWAILDGDELRMMAGYAFDGCSPAMRVLGHWVGTPTPRKAVAAAAVHDCLRGYLGLPCLSYDRKTTDEVFYDMLDAEEFEGRDIYHGAVAGFWGSAFIWLTRGPSTANCKCHPPKP
jgi:hypothetical protein